MKIIYTQQELQELSYEDIQELVSIVSLDGRTIFLDNIVMIEPTKLIMKEGLESINITSPEALQLIKEKMVRFKMLSATGSLGELSEKNRLEHLIVDRLDTIDSNISERLGSINSSVNTSLSSIEKSIDDKLYRIGDELTQNIMSHLIPEVHRFKHETQQLSGAIEVINESISKINFTKLTRVSDKLETITKLLSEVIED